MFPLYTLLLVTQNDSSNPVLISVNTFSRYFRGIFIIILNTYFHIIEQTFKYATYICSNAPRCLVSESNEVKHEHICVIKVLLKSESCVSIMLTISANNNDDSFVVRQQQIKEDLQPIKINISFANILFCSYVSHIQFKTAEKLFDSFSPVIPVGRKYHQEKGFENKNLRTNFEILCILNFYILLTFLTKLKFVCLTDAFSVFMYIDYILKIIFYVLFHHCCVELFLMFQYWSDSSNFCLYY
ncbi:hypothetical protein AGLY_012572 [Aphis glycines]|uniref:Uncharacterized protein n=1 Tax=Aphis glycines TaxID=307491 RepID=A0A6G0T8W2_APHGL|nr:hypothetical protein AGLY_012572 [Aphis glycines]